MRRYETVWVVNGDLPDEDVKATIDKFTKIITNQGGTLVGVEEWGRRKLAYKIQGTFRGCYLMADFAALPPVVKELERNFRIDDRVIRYLTMMKSDQVDLVALETEIAAKAQQAARAAAAQAAAAVQAEAAQAAAALQAEAQAAAAAQAEAVMVAEAPAAPAPEPETEAASAPTAPEKED